MVKRKRKNERTMVDIKIYRNIMNEHHQITKKRDELAWSRKVNSSYSTSGTCHVTFVTNPLISYE